MNKIKLVKRIEDASKKIQPFIRQTYLERSIEFSSIIEGDVWFKLENLQHTGSFKVRGALNKILRLSDSELEKGVITASTGNHGAAVAFASKILNIDCTIYIPENSSDAKISNMKRYGPNILVYGKDSVEAERKARIVADSKSQVYISPYNDIDVIAGQGTIGVELINQCDTMDAIIIAVGGGGLISGVATYLKSLWPKINIIGCSPRNSAVMLKSIDAGKVIDIDFVSTLSDGTAGGVEHNAITFPICSNIIDDKILLTEKEIIDGMNYYLRKERKLLEGSAGMAVAALLKKKEELKGQKVGVIICGGNISLETLGHILEH